MLLSIILAINHIIFYSIVSIVIIMWDYYDRLTIYNDINYLWLVTNDMFHDPWAFPAFHFPSGSR
jgi:hypothetical protein